MQIQAATIVECTHCGETCTDETILQPGASFCCGGCQVVYNILADGGLLDFYALEQTDRHVLAVDTADYAWLDVPKLTDRLINFRAEGRRHVELELPAIHCASCVWLLERLPKLTPGVIGCRVDFPHRKASIVYNPDQTGLREVATTLSRIGYPPIFRNTTEETAIVDRSLIYRIGVAGFFFGNIMLLSFPEYFGWGVPIPIPIAIGIGIGTDAWSMGEAVSYLILAMSLPVLFYSGRSYLKAGYYAITAGEVTIDVPIAIGMLALFGRSAYEILSGTGAGYVDSLAGLIFFLLIGRWFQSFTFSRLNFSRDHRDYFPVSAYRINDRSEPTPVASEDLSADDVILVRSGSLIAADGILLNDNSPAIDYSFVTGEADPVRINAGAEVFAGGRATDSALHIRVTKPANHSYLLQLWLRDDGVENRTEVAPPKRLVQVFTAVILLIAGATFLYWYQLDVSTAFRAATAVLIIACPCALALAAPFAYGTLQRLLAVKGYYFRGPGAVRDLGEVDTFVFDKTGTLTEGNVGEGLQYFGPMCNKIEYVLKRMAGQSRHPKSQAISDALNTQNFTKPSPPVGSITERTGRGIQLDHQGSNYRIGTAAFCGLNNTEPGTYASVAGEAYLKLTNEEVRLREGIATTLNACANQGETWLLSGDHEPNSNFWSAHFHPDRQWFDQNPFAKLRRIEHLRDTGKKVLMIGDGLNDAGALRAAAVGMAVNESEAHFNPACDVIVRADRLAELPSVLQIARRVRWVLFFTYGLAFLYNIIGLSYAVGGTLSPVVAAILMPLSSVSIVVVACLGAWGVVRR
ncbi:heavy metal translocating P-type ATPase [Neolewinella antarctica]|uniref:Cu+-exporting ATPase n=1 Tax=Neolewinella antarctica TaxID=442734 RepID=A0ABX0X9C0_9BACT|nr:heavy metal translocating P-type ATPase metal-binding domain-containing protein [Neolewinella antarctica]NJC25573.1 Cu+-exporting ATPase [Neolewinella antarctica]